MRLTVSNHDKKKKRLITNSNSSNAWQVELLIYTSDCLSFYQTKPNILRIWIASHKHLCKKKEQTFTVDYILFYTQEAGFLCQFFEYQTFTLSTLIFTIASPWILTSFQFQVQIFVRTVSCHISLPTADLLLTSQQTSN